MVLTDTHASGQKAGMLALQRRLFATPARTERALLCFAEIQFDFTTPDLLTEVWYVTDAAARSEGRTCALTNFIKLDEILFGIKKFYLRSMSSFTFSELL